MPHRPRSLRRPSAATVAVVVAFSALLLQLDAPAFAARLITGKDIKDGTLTSADLKDHTVAGADLKKSSVTSVTVANGSLGAADLAPDAVYGGPVQHEATVLVGPDDSLTFVPRTLTVPQGTLVTFWWHGGLQHNVISDDGTSFASGPQTGTSGHEYKRFFDTVGTFNYHCAPHGAPGGSGMSGTIVVTAG